MGPGPLVLFPESLQLWLHVGICVRLSRDGPHQPVAFLTPELQPR